MAKSTDRSAFGEPVVMNQDPTAAPAAEDAASPPRADFPGTESAAPAEAEAASRIDSSLAPQAAPPSVSAADVAAILSARCADPHSILGPHRATDGSVSVRAFLPHAASAAIACGGGETVEMQRIAPEGFFEAIVEDAPANFAYEIVVVEGGGRRTRLPDAYAFAERDFTARDAHLFESGRHARLFEKLGAHPRTIAGARGVRFAVWAPNAERVSVVGVFNQWDGRRHPMRRLAESGVWELFVPGAAEGDLYKFEIRAPGGLVFLKADPFAFRSETPPQTASIVHDIDWGHSWLDGRWIRHDREMVRQTKPFVRFPFDLDQPREIAGVSSRCGFRDLIAARLPHDIAAEGFTQLELLAGGAGGWWGGAGLFAVGDAYGAPEDLMDLVDECHQAGLGVLLPEAAGGIPAAPEELAWFDGTQLFFREFDAGAANGVTFAIERGEVRSVMLSRLAFWIDRYHFDGIVGDADQVALLRDLCAREESMMRHVCAVARFTPTTAPPESASASADQIAAPAPTVAPAADVRAAFAALIGGRCSDPHALLGVRLAVDGRGTIIRALLPEATQAHAVFDGDPHVVYELAQIDPAGMFEALVPEPTPTSAYRIHARDRNGQSTAARDPYAFRAFTFSDLDQHLFAAGNHYRIYEKLGGHPDRWDGADGVRFAVWAPNAAGVSVVGPFNHWDGRRHPMHRHGVSGVWEIFIPDLKAGELYKFEMRSAAGHVFLKADPYALATETPPATASIVYPLEDRHHWRDEAWMAARTSAKPWEQPVAIYEAHLGSWLRQPGGKPPTFRELGERLIPYVKDLGFTHIELLPIAEHPYEPSWGYQVTNYFAPTSRLGRPEDLMAFVDLCHHHGIGVILDWVPGHFPKDAFALAWFDGTHLYEHADPRQGEHQDWGTLIFNYGRHEVENFLIANAIFWLEHYHFDGLRVDAVASMLYLDYSRKKGDWIPNKYGGRENIDAIEFIKHTNAIVHDRFPGVLMIAEESTAWPKVSRPAYDGGLGFGFKWNMGWMHDVLGYFAKPPEERRHHHGKITFGLLYAFDENFILALSHDEVVHMKGSLLDKMPGDDRRKFANLRLLYLFLYAHPGKKLLFMGAEFGQRSEWSHARSLDWHLLELAPHQDMKRFLAALNRIYRSQPALFEVDGRRAGFEWLAADDAEESIVAFLRKAADPRDALMVAINFSDLSRPGHRFGVPYPVAYDVLFDSNDVRFGGARTSPLASFEAEPVPWHGHAFSVELPMAALSGLILKPRPLVPRRIEAS